jgi:hypothetical protein
MHREPLCAELAARARATPALDACLTALTEAGRRAYRREIRVLSRGYDRERALRVLLPALCDKPLDPFRRLADRWHRDDAATTRALMRAIVGSMRAAMWDQAHGSRVAAGRIYRLRMALAGEWSRYQRQRSRELFAPSTEVATAD